MRRSVQWGFLKRRVTRCLTPIRYILGSKRKLFSVRVPWDHRRAYLLHSEVQRRQGLCLLEIERGVTEHLRKLLERDICRFRIHEEDDDARDDTEPQEDEVIPAGNGIEKRRGDEGYDKVGQPVRDGR